MIKVFKFLKPILKGVFDATPLGAVKNAIKDYKDNKNIVANRTYVFTFLLTLFCLFLFYLGKLDFDMLLTLIKKLN